jgi:predicted branched-subunit amino acid permease
VRLLFVSALVGIAIGIGIILTNDELFPRILGSVVVAAGAVEFVVALLVRFKSPPGKGPGQRRV